MRNKSNYPKFLLLWAGDLISQIGGGLTSFGLGVYVFNQTNSASLMALITLCGFLPTIALSVPAGVLADMYDRRKLMMIGDGCSAIGIAYILICMFTGKAEVWQICLGVFVSSLFSALLEPSYRATITDILTKEEYTKANSLASLAGSARYLVSPVMAGILLASYDIKLLLIIDICTFFVTFTSTLVVRRSIGTTTQKSKEDFFANLKIGWHEVYARKGVFELIAVSSVITMFLGVIQVLSEPLVLAFSSSKILGICETVCALGMVVTALITGITGIRKNHSKVLALSLCLAGVFMIGYAAKENILCICIFGFLFFMMLPLANSSLDYLARINIPDELQGRVWGFIGFISQLGYIPAYALSGVLADRAGSNLNIGVGRGAALIIAVAGTLLVITSLATLGSRRIRNLENAAELVINTGNEKGETDSYNQQD